MHVRWKASLEPILTIRSGDVVAIECRDGFDGQVSPPVTAADLNRDLYGVLDWRRVAPLTGPIAVEGAQPGDALEVQILELVPFGTGTVVIFPSWVDNDFLLKEQRSDFPNGWLRHFDMDRAWRDGYVEFKRGMRIPLRPMLGMVGTAPQAGEFITNPPRDFGGNMDIRDVVAGTRVYLPVYQPGALLSIGDGHGVQGDGEVCTTAIETPMRATVRLWLHEDRQIPGPQLETADEFMTIGYGRTLDQAAQRALRYMLDDLVERRGFDGYEAYAFLSLSGHVRISEVVDFPHVGVRVVIPKQPLAPFEW